MRIRRLTIYFFALVSLSLYGQEDNILLKVNDREVSSDEFKWLYLKNNRGEQYSDIDEYLDLYIKLRLKVEAAEDAGIQNRPSFKNELAGYRKQLAKDYLTDQNIKDRVLEKAYERYKTEINAYHILIKCPPDAHPDDTLKAYEKAMNIRQRIRLGEPFESVAKGASDDPGVNINGGNLGYFTVFQTPLPFENAVYEMNPGELSMPVRTSNGYHIIKLQNKRNNQGKIKVSHIMKATPPGSTSEQRKRARHSIDSLYKLLEEGADFGELAVANSDDRLSAQNWGELPWFGTGEMIHEFSNAAFSLLRDGEYTGPVKSVYGWHIIKRLDKKPFPEYKEAEKYLENRLSQSYLLTLSKKSFADSLKKEYAYNINREALKWFYPVADSSFRYSVDYRIDKDIPDNILYSFADQQCSMTDFAEYIRKNGHTAAASDSIGFINELLDQKVYDHLIDYEDSVLEDKYPEFKYLMNEFYDGILFFEITDSLIWQRSVEDSTGLAEYYDTRKEEFTSKTEARARIYEISNVAGKRKSKRLMRYIRKNHNKPDYYQNILNESVSGRDTLVSISEGSWKEGENDILDSVKWSRGIYQTKSNNGTILVDIIEIKKEELLSLEEIRGTIIGDYQKYLENQWITELKKIFEVSVNRDVFIELKSELGK